MKKVLTTVLVLSFGAVSGGVGYAVDNNYKKADIKDLNIQVEQKETTNNEQKNEIASLNSSVNKLTTEKNELLSDNAVKNEEITNLNLSVTNKQKQIEDLQKDMTAKSDKIDLLNSQLTATNAKVTSLEADIEANNVEISRLEAEGAANAETINSLKADSASKAAEIATLSQEKTDKENELNELQTNFTELQDKCQNYYMEMEESQARVTELENEIDTNNTTITDLNTQLTQKQSELEALQLSVNEKDATLTKLQNLNSLDKKMLPDGNYVYYGSSVWIFDKTTGECSCLDGITDFVVNEVAMYENNYVLTSISDKYFYVISKADYSVKRIGSKLGVKKLFNFNENIVCINDTLGYRALGSCFSNNVLWMKRISNGNFIGKECYLDLSDKTITSFPVSVDYFVQLKNSNNDVLLYSRGNGFYIFNIQQKTVSNVLSTSEILLSSGYFWDPELDCGMSALEDGNALIATSTGLMLFDIKTNTCERLENFLTSTTKFFETKNYILFEGIKNGESSRKRFVYKKKTQEIVEANVSNWSYWCIDLSEYLLIPSTSGILLYEFETDTSTTISSPCSTPLGYAVLSNGDVLITNKKSGKCYVSLFQSSTKTIKTLSSSEPIFWNNLYVLSNGKVALFSTHGGYVYGGAVFILKDYYKGLKVFDPVTSEFKMYFENDDIFVSGLNSQGMLEVNVNGIDYVFDGENFIVDLKAA